MTRSGWQLERPFDVKTSTIPAPTRRRRRAQTPSESIPSGAHARSVVAAILDGCALHAAEAFADARRLALRLHNARQSDEARMALDVAESLSAIATEAHDAAEYAASAVEGGVTW